MKRCSKCKIKKSLDSFYNNKSTKDGKSHQCKECYSLYRSKNRDYNRKYMEMRRKTDNETLKKIKRKSWRNLDPRKRMLSHAKQRSRLKGFEFNLELEDIIIPPVCPLLLIPFEYGEKGKYSLVSTLDRIDSTKGYIKGNIWVISMKANSMKNSATREELLTFAQNIIKYFTDDDIVQTLGRPKELKDKEPLG